MDSHRLSSEDQEQLHNHGVTPEEASRQLEFLASPPPPKQLRRPCTVGDGIQQLSAADYGALEERFAKAEAGGRVTKFVPASGAASRMFGSLLPYLRKPRKAQREELEKAAAEGHSGAKDLLRLAESLSRFAFYEDLRKAIRQMDASLAGALHQGDLGFVLRVILGKEFLGYARAPKALIPFHKVPGGYRTALEEHFVEALSYARDEEGRCRLHFTVADTEATRFEAAAFDATERLCQGGHPAGPSTFDLGFSRQHPATDTLALAADGSPFRKDNGRLLLRPGGHGALLRNLHELQGDLVFIKNIDNVVPDHLKSPTLRFKRLLGGYLLALQEQIFELQSGLAEGGRSENEALDFLVEELHIDAGQIPEKAQRRSFALERLHRPIRVCGVVANTGEPGGGPFWVDGGATGASRQIVEAAQVAKTPEQQEILSGSTHFNPVDLVCGVRDFRGEAFDLHRFVDRDTAFVSRKVHQGRPLKALERPGLWNGAMAFWHTFFVEVPSETFAPVKTVFDLLRPEHQES